MKVKFLKSSSVLVEANGKKILTDPWLVDGAYYGSWCHSPPFKFTEGNFSDIDLLYISHIHPDHFDPNTLTKLDKKIPVAILEYREKFLKNNLSRLGFSVIEIANGETYYLSKDVGLTIFAADDCDPEVCQKHFGCLNLYGSQTGRGTAQIDSICTISDGKSVLVNINDAPYSLSFNAINKIKKQFNTIDFLLTSYAGAGEYPQCFLENHNSDSLSNAIKIKKRQFLNQGRKYITFFKPKYYMPFAGTYTLSGKLAVLNKWRGIPELDEALRYFKASTEIDHETSKPILLDTFESLDLSTNQIDRVKSPIDRIEKDNYTSNFLAKKKFDYELDSPAEFDTIISLIDDAYCKMESYRSGFDYSSDQVVLIDFGETSGIQISMNGSGVNLVSINDYLERDNFLKITIDPRLLLKLLKGPRYAHWNNASIGSHLKYFRRPNSYDRGLHYCLNFFHT